MRIGIGLGLPQIQHAGGGASPDYWEFDFLTGSLPQEVAFGRASGGTYFGSDGLLALADVDAARFDHTWDGEEWQLAGLLIEEQRTNQLMYSTRLNTNWTPNQISWTPDAANAPDGAATASLNAPTVTNTNGHSRTQPNVPVSDPVPVTLSLYFRPGSVNYRGGVELRPQSGSQRVTAYADYATSSVVYQARSGSGSRLDGAGVVACDTYARVHVTGLPTNATMPNGSRASLYVAASTGDGTASFSGDGVDGPLFWGAQYEIGSFPTSYIYTDAAIGTRAADQLSLPLSPGEWDLTAETSDGTLTGRVTVDDGYIFDWNDLTGFAGHRHLRNLIAEKV